MRFRVSLATLVTLAFAGSVAFLLCSIVYFFFSDEETGSWTTGPGDRSLAERSSGVEASTEPRSALERDLADVRRLAAEASPDDDSPALLIEGRVVDQFEQPLAEAVVWLRLSSGEEFGAAPLEGTVGPVSTVMTSDDGWFAFVGDETPDRALPVTLLVRAPNHAPLVSRHHLEARSRVLEVGDLELFSGGGIHGCIVDQAGSGVPGAIAALQPTSSNPLAPWSDLDDLLEPITADAAGQYRIANLIPGWYRLTASASNMQEVRLRSSVLVEDGVETAVEPIEVGPGQTLAGVVLGPDGIRFARSSPRTTRRNPAVSLWPRVSITSRT